MDTQSTSVNKKHVLVVDDDLDLALTYQALLEGRGHRASTAGNGLEALNLVMNSDVDAVLCDLCMPELSGDFLYLEVVRARPDMLKRFIFLTGEADNPLYEAFKDCVKPPVLSKPISFDRLFEELKAVLEA